MVRHAFCRCGCVGAPLAEWHTCAPVRACKHLACKSSEIHAHVLRCVHTLSFIFICSQILSEALIYSHMRPNELRCSQTSSDPMRFLRIPPDPLKCHGATCFLPLCVRGRAVCGMSRPIAHCSPVRARKHLACKSSQIHSDTPRCSHMLPFAFRCSQMLSDAIRCFQILHMRPNSF